MFQKNIYRGSCYQLLISQGKKDNDIWSEKHDHEIISLKKTWSRGYLPKKNDHEVITTDKHILSPKEKNTSDHCLFASYVRCFYT